MNKEDIRKEVKNQRKMISNKKELSTIIVNTIKELDIYQRGRVIGIYNSMPDEVDTTNLFVDGKIFLLPKVVNDNLVFIKIDSNTKYSKSKLGVEEPINNDIYDGKIDLIIVPGVVFDKKLNRLGYGKGYYDQYLKNKDIYKIGICFDIQLIDKLPVDNYDIPMDMIVTEKRIIKKV